MRRALCSLVSAAIVILSAAGCSTTARYFHDAGVPADPVPLYTLENLPSREYWTGVVFNGSKIGFTHTVISPSQAQPGSFEISGQAYMNFRFLMMEKKISAFSHDLVDRDLHLLSFSCEYDIDGNSLSLEGAFRDGILRVHKSTGKTEGDDEVKVQGELYPASVVNIYPLVHGLEKGRRYAYRVYDAETQSIADVSQEVLAFERSDLFDGEAFRIKTRYLGQDVTTWINDQGLPILEMALGGVVTSCVENEQQARRYLLEASFNKQESLLDFSLVRVDKPIQDPDRSTSLEAYIDGVPLDMTLPSDERQTCERTGDRILCRIRAGLPEGGQATGTGGQEAVAYLASTTTIPSSAPEIRKLAREITKEAPDRAGQVMALLAWIRGNIRKEPVDSFSALDVLAARKAECQGHAYLYAAFARSLGIPTRIANGIVYAKDFKGFLYHAWAESLVDGRWVAIDPTLGQMPADATHIKFAEGEAFSAMMPLVNLMGRIRIEVSAVK